MSMMKHLCRPVKHEMMTLTLTLKYLSHHYHLPLLKSPPFVGLVPPPWGGGGGPHHKSVP